MGTHPIFESDFDCLTDLLVFAMSSEGSGGCEGPLCKWTNVMRGWAWRWFVLSDNTLTYYTSKEKRLQGDKRGQLKLNGAFLSIEEDTNFSITVEDHTYHFQAPDGAERQKWVNSLEAALQSNQNRPQTLLRDSGNIIRRIEEAEKYIKFIEQLQQKIQISGTEEAETLAALASGLIENGAESALMLRAAAGKGAPMGDDADVATKQNRPAESVEDDLDSGSDDNELGGTLTSSDEDEFHDCDDLSDQRSIMSVMDDLGDIEFMQEEDNRGGREGENVDQHKSVIMHLIKQVKIGMDLTRVVLPTFILERRSLLEMYSDFFAHADFFSEIPTLSTERERMIAVLKWYLTSFHAGRNGSVAKKPYNPILGETFRCFWNVGDTGPNRKINKKGPVPWSAETDVCFLAEQVSHHPPISAFYAENKSKNVQFTAHIWTKSQFYGLSIGVVNEGFGLLELLGLNETYRINFPEGYCRSILTVPWVELGGDCKIESSTGYRADVKFHTKPMFGNRLHKVTANCYEPNTKKPFAEFEGEWNADYHYTEQVGSESRGPTEFVDTRKISTMKKYVKALNLQEPTESRRLWRELTEHLRNDNIEQATNAKKRLEQKQRDDRKYRDENNIVYQQKLFVKNNNTGGWRYIADLKSRTQSS